MADNSILEMRPDGWALIHAEKMLLVCTHEEVEKMRRRGKIWKRNADTKRPDKEIVHTPYLYR